MRKQGAVKRRDPSEQCQDTTRTHRQPFGHCKIADNRRVTVFAHYCVCRFRDVCAKAKHEILGHHVPCGWELVISFSNPVKPPSLLEHTDKINTFSLSVIHSVQRDKIVPETLLSAALYQVRNKVRLFRQLEMLCMTMRCSCCLLFKL